MIGRGKASAIVGAALLFAVSGAEAASHGSSGGGGTHSNSTTTPFHPALQSCTGPAHQCGKPICHTSNVTHCVPRPGPPGRGMLCYTAKIKSCI
jgi:hypothetical protein